MILLFLTTWFITHFEPVQSVFDTFLLKKTIPNFVHNLLSCWQCQVFWATLFIRFSIFEALILSFSAWFFQAITEK